MNPRGFHTITLGCKLNQFDSAAIEGELARRGFMPEPDPRRAAVVVVNTCTVTHRADADARKLIRAVRRGNDRCKLLVTGCYAEADAQALEEIAGVDRVFGNRDKPRLASILDDLGVWSTPAPGGGDRGCEATADPSAGLHFGERSRAFLKVQEGCRLACSYCIIPRVRGASRSVPPDQLEEVFAALLRRGYPEVVLTGVNTGDYGRDLEERIDLAGLLRRLLAVAGDRRIRLNSLEPRTVTDEIVDLMASEPRLAPHLQVPLQSGSPEILRRMRRNYRREDYLDRLTRLREAIPGIGLGADVIVGFPGETGERFEESYAFVERSPLNYLHVFSWSPRSGTPAADLEERVDPRVVRERSARMRALGEAKSHRFRLGFQGKRLDAVVLGDNESGQTRALTGNFIEVLIPSGSAPRGASGEIEIERVEPTGTFASWMGRSARLAGPTVVANFRKGPDL